MIKKSNTTQSSSAVEKLLGCGRFQGVTFLCIQWVTFCSAWNMMFMVFGKAMPKKWSFANSFSNNTNEFGNGTDNVDANLFSCSCTNTPEGCQNFTWQGDFYSIVPHWQLVCDRVKIIYFIITIQMIGVFVGSPLFGQISDTFGRKWTLFGSLSMLIIFGSSSAFSPDWRVFAAFRFLVGVSLGGTITTSHVLLMEMLTQKHRLWLSSIAGWPVAFAVMSLIGYLTADWRVFAIVTNLAGLPALALILFVGESPRWLLQKQKSALADNQLRRIVRINNNVLDEKALLSLVEDANKKTSIAPLPEIVPLTEKAQQNEPTTQSGTKKYSYWHLFSTKKMAIHTVVLAICYFCTSNVSNGVVFNVDKLSGNLFLNFFLLACLRWVSNGITIVADLLLSKFGRKIGFVLPFSTVAVASAAIVVLSVTGQNLINLHTVISITSLLIAMLCSPIWVMLGLAMSENYPTPIRNIAAAFTATCNRLGSVAVPQFLYLGHFWAPAPFVVFTAFSLTAAILFCIFIPETKGIPLPDTMPSRERALSLTISLRRDSIAVYKPIKSDSPAVYQVIVVNEESINEPNSVPSLVITTER